ncbi:hypothetical protein AB0A98_06515 [Streptomyces chrestomyceticus]|uniref:hypothetical protein n=1 Tax=Streptomyces chrestomyceticus TaxID=68185 RepID=UPI0033F4B04E
MQDFTSSGTRANPKPGPADQNVGFTGLGVDGDDPYVTPLRNAIAENFASMDVTDVTFVEPGEITDARNQIRGREDTYMHVSDGTFRGRLCDYTVQRAAPSGAPECPVCVLLDA